MKYRCGRILRWIAGAAMWAPLVGCPRSPAPVASWCRTGTGAGEVVYPRGIARSPVDGSFFIVDRMARVQRLDDRGEPTCEWRMPEWSAGKPVGISVAPDGRVWIPDTHYGRIMIYSPRGELLATWGRMGTGRGEFVYPTDVAFDRFGDVYVSEYGDNDRIQVFSPDGTWLRQFGAFGQGPGEFSRPQSMVIDGDLIYVADACNHRIDVFTIGGAFVRSMGKVGSGAGEFRFPYGLDMDADGHLMVCEFGNSRVQWIDKETGRCLRLWGRPGRDDGELAYPWAVAAAADGRVAVVDAGNNRIVVVEGE